MDETKPGMERTVSVPPNEEGLVAPIRVTKSLIVEPIAAGLVGLFSNPVRETEHGGILLLA
jgi:hypothetical protein